MEDVSSFGFGEETLREIERHEREILAKDCIENSIIEDEPPKNIVDLSCRIKVATQIQCEKRKERRSRCYRNVHNITSISRLLESNSFNEMDFSSWERSMMSKISPEKSHQNSSLVRNETSTHEQYDNDNVTFMLPREEENKEDFNSASMFIAKELSGRRRVDSFHNESILSEARNISHSQNAAAAHNISLSVDTKKDLKYLKNWNLPLSVVNEYRRKGIEEMFQWQCECLKNQKVLFDGANLVYSAPTSAGKTFVSEVLMIKNIVERKKKALFILPFVSVVREKIYTLQELLSSSGIRVDGYFGGYQPAGRFESLNLIICTIEKANSIINRLLEQNKLDEIGMIVIDEIHLISDTSRGYILELLLTKVLFMNHKIQLIGMSATLPNVDLLCKWLKAEIYITNYRPIDLKEMIKIDKSVYDSNMKLIRHINNKWSEYFENDADDICELAMETVKEKHQLLIFCPSKDWCEQLCTNFARGIYKILKFKPEILVNVVDRSKIDALLSQGKSLATGLDQKLETCLKYGAAFHHAGLTTDERDLVEMGFKEGILKVLFATSTLSAGVNLPARRVIIRTPMFGPTMMSNLTYRQMIGRAGRKGQDTLGESILVCNSSNSRMGKELISIPLKPISSCLNVDNYAHLKRAILEIIAANMANTKEELEKFINQTLYCQEHQIDFTYFKSRAGEEDLAVLIKNKTQKKVNDLNVKKDDSETDDPIKNSMNFLLEYEFIRLHTDDETDEMKFVPTRLGLACLSSGMPPKDGFMLLAELQKARQNFVLECDLHAIYLVTPFSVAYQLQQIDWTYFVELYDKLPEMMKRVGKMVGVSDTFLIKAITGRQNSDWHAQQIHKRFYTALALQELVNEQPISSVSEKYKIPRGLLQSLQQSASSFAAILTSFCQSLQWDLLVLILKQFRERLYFGIPPDLIDLMKISSITSTRIARAIYDSGVHDLTMLANSKKHEIEDVLLNNLESSCGNFFINGKGIGMSVQEMTKLLISDARSFVQNELGLKDIKWNAEEESVKENNFKSPAVISSSSTKRKRDKSLEVVKTPAKKIYIEGNVEYKRKLRSSLGKEDENTSLFKNSDIILNDISDHLNIVAVLDDGVTYTNFVKECRRQSQISMSIGLAKFQSKGLAIGGNLLNKNEDEKCNFMMEDKQYVACVCITFESLNNQVYYLDLQNCKKMELIANVKNFFKLLLFKKSELTINFYDSSQSVKILKVFGIQIDEISSKIFDTRLASWILNPDGDFYMKEMVAKFAPEHSKILDFVNQSTEPKIRAAIECFLIKEIRSGQLKAMEQSNKLLKVLESIELPIQLVLAKMETIGFPVSKAKLYSAIERSSHVLKKLENYVYKLNGGRKFDLSSSKAVAKVVGIHRNHERAKVSTAKNVLAKLDSPIADSIMQYRTLSTTISNIQPMTQIVRDDRIYSRSFSFTQTGRISMHEPNLQNVTKTFTVEFKDDSNSSCKEIISFRSVFECKEGKILLSADFCQLEMRILTHLSKDPKLTEIMKCGKEDIFRKIAAKWNRIDEKIVTEVQRNQTKQLCYGIIYGMGNKALAEKMNVDEATSAKITEEFHTTYPHIRRYTENIVKKTKDKGYIETVTCRRRYLPSINSEDSSERSKAERQALNSTIQGSASDLVKNAILRMEKNIKKKNFMSHCNLVMHLHDELYYEVSESQWKEIAEILVNSMENGVALHVPLQVKIKIGKNWGEMKEVNL